MRTDEICCKAWKGIRKKTENNLWLKKSALIFLEGVII